MSDGERRNMEPENVPASRYDDELLCANWNPVIALLGRSGGVPQGEVAHAGQRPIPEEDAESFLRRIYAAGT